MSLIIRFYNNKSDRNVVNKNIELTYTSSMIDFKGDMDVTHPIILLGYSHATIDQIIQRSNYLYCDGLYRYYYIDKINVLRDQLVEIQCSVDVLMSFKDQIKNCSGIVKRQENNYNLYLNDGSLKVYQNPHIVTKPFPQGFTGSSYLLAIAGE